VYRARGAAFYRLALATTGHLERAQDAVQEGFARAIRGRESFRGSGSLKAWICRCVLNAARDERELVPNSVDFQRRSSVPSRW
jgi:DNA-directed RNA polymerase specialized sigma24 family protein